MSILQAKQIIRKLRSGGVKVYLGPRGVTFSSLENVAPDIKQALPPLGPFLKKVLEEEMELRQTRERMRTGRKTRSPLDNVNTDEL